MVSWAEFIALKTKVAEIEYWLAVDGNMDDGLVFDGGVL
jgi:hypothetical protein